MITKIGHTFFEHTDDFKGEVELRKGDISFKVPMESLRTFVAECVRKETIAQLERMQPKDLLRKIA